MTHLRGLIALTLTSAALLMSCTEDPESEDSDDGTCTLIGCEDIFSAEFSSPLGPGEYEVVVETEDGETTCTLEVSEGSNENVEWTDQCSDDQVIGVNPRSVGVAGQPAAVSVTIRDVNSEEMSFGEFTPTYELTHPNGPNCGSCAVASGQMPEMTESTSN